jgi:hypothetical protein
MILAVAGCKTCAQDELKIFQQVALANKNAHIAWALLTKETDFLPEGEPA